MKNARGNRCLVTLALLTVAATAGCAGPVPSGSAKSPVESASQIPSSLPSAVPTATASPSASPSPPGPVWRRLSFSKPIDLLEPWVNAPSIVAWHGKQVGLGEIREGKATVNAVAASVDLVHWTVLASGAKAPDARYLLVGPAGLVAVGDQWRLDIWKSTDGAAWKQVKNLPFPDDAVDATNVEVAAGPKGLVAVETYSFHPGAWFSTDGSTWTRVAGAPAIFGDNTVITVSAGPTGFFATGDSSVAPDQRRSGTSACWVGWWSSDGHAWLPAKVDSSGGSLGFSSVTVANFAARGMLIAEGLNEWRSSDGLNWVKKADTLREPDYGDFLQIVDDGNRIVAFDVLSDGSLHAWDTFDGWTWTELSLTSNADAVSTLAGWEIGYAAFTPSGLTLLMVDSPAMADYTYLRVIRVTATP